MNATDSGMNIIADFLHHVSKLHNRNILYRGHANIDWRLIPSAARDFVFGIKNREHLSHWKEMAGRLVGRPQSDLEWLVLAQHYGVPTMLLDWTTNPLIALYFACQELTRISEVFNNGAVVYVSKETFRFEPDPTRIDVFTNGSFAPLLVPSLVMNKRSLAQDSVMTLHNEHNFNPATNFNPIVYTIPGDMRGTVINALRDIGVSSDRIYADINTVAREFSDELAKKGRFSMTLASQLS